MSTYARIDNGIVVEMFAPPPDITPTDVFDPSLVWVDCTSNANVAPGWIATEAGGAWAFAPPADPPPPTLPEQAAALLTTPITVVSNSKSALNADYPNDDPTRSQIAAIMTKINAGNGLPGGGNTFNWPDVGGGARQWPGQQFADYAGQVADFIYQATQVQQGHSTTLPSTTLTIA